jgi:hypothetical protein
MAEKSHLPDGERMAGPYPETVALAQRPLTMIKKFLPLSFHRFAKPIG